MPTNDPISAFSTSPHPNRISIGSAVFAGFTYVPTNRQADRPRYHGNDRPHPMYASLHGLTLLFATALIKLILFLLKTNIT